ncbi:peptidase [Brucella abortus]|uniref:NlpC/P60 family protein n=1 Tax=Brucella abortus TaxID=235 RepID=UPI0004E8D43C|nr:NlpC/P60 family protein [Brucella abortus]KFH18440.1 peptidase [Brucella abortus LMN1]RUQ67329.1 peptidase [Brucella abortus]RUQ77944.1 peptidase [Brucella abortus]RUQ88282.1 peptidase [Brucella abortus]RUQ90311.1 peptidase [Brucella abortus]
MAEASSGEVTRDQIVALARSWLGTPYRHQASVKGAGADCLGVLRGVYAELYGRAPETPPAYRPDWYDLRRDDLLLRKAHEYLAHLPDATDARSGDVLVFRMKPDMAAKHCGILTEHGRMVHALTGKDVEEVTLNSWYGRRVVAAFSFPGVVD